MPRKVVTIERSVLARNIYFLLLSKLLPDEKIEVKNLDVEDSIIKEGIEGIDLIILSLRADELKNEDKTKSLLNSVKEAPHIIIIHKGVNLNFDDTGKGRFILKRPFFPEDFLNIVKELWKI
jgi:hypothetical protein